MSWSVRNVRDMQWWNRGPRGFVTLLVEDDDAQVGVNLFVLGPGEPMSMYHWEADQEGFLVLSGEALLVVDDEERPLRQWDYFHKPAGVSHTILGAGSGPHGVRLDEDECPLDRHRGARAPGQPRLGRLSAQRRRDEARRGESRGDERSQRRLRALPAAAGGRVPRGLAALSARRQLRMERLRPEAGAFVGRQLVELEPEDVLERRHRVRPHFRDRYGPV